jgi:hypothetical protein
MPLGLSMAEQRVSAQAAQVVRQTCGYLAFVNLAAIRILATR